MQYFDIYFVEKIHNSIIDEIGGIKGYNKQSIGYLISALNQIQNDDFYPNFIDKITHLIFACVKFHPFLDGNKRTAIHISRYFAKLNGINFNKDYFKKMENIVIKLAENSLSKEDLKEFLRIEFLNNEIKY
ncbi:MAG: type II toxin-antitoxin system death-on-curing family toxin [Campylobacter sputorum]|uniref:type II toxin-antitoxin system death-on-curing family toxin n=2 Tax=Campylobacter sputorum TaxID=206 RepID=UPI000B774E8A|nr:type II toxin-antitoxin system death-on-curing family toxin [Campylobacter sputorum]ASM39114.1 Fic/DOC family protein [Campylobacter sputorum bv. paraureolyticus LMG 11764]MDY6120130.1 type II toxin-antitoxin system death-on-curing family toxin [Campylobacter sputorum]